MAVQPEVPRQLSVGIATRNRAASLARCISSLALLGDLVADITVVDDSSDEPIEPALDQLPAALRDKLTIVAQRGRQGPITARNTMMERAKCDIVLLLDDDTLIVAEAGIRRAFDLILEHPSIGAVAFAMAGADGTPLPASMQPSAATYLSYVPAYIGFAHLLRRQLFLDLGRYRRLFHFYGEEKDYCLRLLNAGYHVVYEPDALVAHLFDPSGRSQARYLRYVVRNDCLYSLYNEPLALMCASIPVRLHRYVKMRRRGGVKDPGGFRWILAELVKSIPAVVRDREPVRWSSVRRWRRLRRALPAFGPEPA
jgi:GT2 family glycosyltransferase